MCAFLYIKDTVRDKLVPVNTAWRVLRLLKEERPPIWRVAANILNKQSRTADEGWSSSLMFGQRANNSSPWKTFVTEYSQDHWGDPDVDWRMILRWIFGKWEGVETGWSWLRIGTDGGHLWIRWWTFGFYKVGGISWLAAEPVSFSRRTLLHGVSK